MYFYYLSSALIIFKNIWYNRDIKEISVFENIRNGDILKFNKIKVEHDIKMQKMASQREI